MTTKANITGVVANEPVTKLTKGDEQRPPELVCSFGVYEMVEGPDKSLKDTGRLINVHCYSPVGVSMQTGDIVKVHARRIYSGTYERNGKPCVRYMANTRGYGVKMVQRKRLLL